MQLKNTEKRHLQFFYHNESKKAVDFVHIPAGATVELNDEIFNQICKPLTTVEKQELVIQKIEAETPILMEKKDVYSKEYYATGERRKVNLVKEMIKSGALVIVERVAVTDEVKAKLLNSKGIATKDMTPEQLNELYEQLA